MNIMQNFGGPVKRILRVNEHPQLWTLSMSKTQKTIVPQCHHQLYFQSMTPMPCVALSQTVACKTLVDIIKSMNGEYHGSLPQDPGLFHFQSLRILLELKRWTKWLHEWRGFSLRMTESHPQANSLESLMLQNTYNELFLFMETLVNTVMKWSSSTNLLRHGQFCS